MKNIYKALCFVVIAALLVACPKDDGASFVIRERQEVYDENILEIEEYLKTNYLTVNSEMNATVTKIEEGGTEVSIWDQYKSSLFGDEVPYITVKNDSRNSVGVDGRVEDEVDYKLYYIVLNEGGGVTPASIDSTFTAYRGWNLTNVTFDQNIQGVWSSFPESNISLISGYRQILSQIKTEGSLPTVNSDGTVTRYDYGNVIVFIPSGLAYFNNSSLNIGQYAPICFQIKLFSRKERDHDNDRVKSKYEDLNNDGDYFNDDTDGDNLPDFFDVDDDGDGYLTKAEITKPTPLLVGQGISLYYPFDPNVDEPKGIPDASGDGTTSTRLRRHLDRNTIPPYTTY